MRYTKTTLRMLETLVEEGGYRLRAEKGNFAPGHCIIQSARVVVVNKYFDTEARILALLDLIPQLDLDHDALSDASKEMLHTVLEIESGA